MREKELVVPIYLKKKRAAKSLEDRSVFLDRSPSELAVSYSNRGADALLVFDLSEGDREHEDAIGQIKEIARAVDIPVYGGGNIRRMEDVKKLIYAGCQRVFLNYGKEGNVELTQEVSSRFGMEKILACVKTEEELQEACRHETVLGGILSLAGPAFGERAAEIARDCGRENGRASELTLLALVSESGSELEAACRSALACDNVEGVCCPEFMDPEFDHMALKHELKAAGIWVNTFESSVSWEDFKQNGDGLLPVVVQDYKTQEVLMVAYMNREAFETTVRTGRMTYWSRSRRELWVKGLTSGHFQYVKELLMDCDNDTLLAKVLQIGAACHTGNKSCFYRTILKREYDETNPLKVFEDVFQVIEDRKLHPKEGSYTNYLFDKGIDKILKKVGEEATEIIIAAKNPDPEEIKYEISDFLYHVMVLMAERGVTWEDITKELARR